MSLEVILYNDITSPIWDKFCLENDMAWFVHTSEWIDYTLNMRFEKDSLNHSFAVCNNNKILALIPLIEETIIGTKFRELGFAGLNCPFPAFANELGFKHKKKVEKKIFLEIFKIKRIDYNAFYICPLIDQVLCKDIITNHLLKHDFHDTTITTNILRLGGKKEEDLMKNMRKGHKADIKYASKIYNKVEIIDINNFNEEKFNNYKIIHAKAAGRQTRPDKTWELMQNWIRNEYSVLALLKKEDLYISAIFVNTYKRKAYYHSSCTLPNYQNERGIGQLLQWEIIKYLNEINFSHYELGWNWYPNISQEVADKKMLGISKFKAGFGGDIYPVFRGEYFINREFMKEIYNKRLDLYLSRRNMSNSID